jgi:hypothetical protein
MKKLPAICLFLLVFCAQFAAQNRAAKCPGIKVETSPIAVIDGYPMTFTAKVIDKVKGLHKNSPLGALPRSGGGMVLKYKWIVSGGEITEGQGTTEIKVDTLGYQGEAIKATVIVRSLPKRCKTRASATGFVKPKQYLN